MSYETRTNFLRRLYRILSDARRVHSLLDDSSSVNQPTEFYSQP